MKEEIRRAVVSTVAAKVTGKAPSSIYSHERGAHAAMADGYDYESGSHFTDSYHYGTGSHFNVRVKGDKFEGYDYGDGCPFTGTIKGGAVEIYDHGERRHFNYSI